MADLSAIPHFLPRLVGKAVGAFSVELLPADQARYRDTARSDFAVITRHWAFYSAVGVLTVAATIVTAEDSKLSGVLKIVLLAIGAGAGAVVALGILGYGAALAAAPHRQRKFHAEHAAELEAQAVSAAEHEKTEEQFAAALKVATDVLPFQDLEPIRLAWFRTTRSLVADVFGALEAAKLESRLTVDERRERLEELADRFRDGQRHAPSHAWDNHVELVGKFYDLLWDMRKEGDELKGAMLAKDPNVGRPDVDDWLKALGEVLDLMPDFVRFTYNHDPVVGSMFATYEGIDDPEINLAITLLDRRLPYIGEMLPPLKSYAMALRSK